MNANRLRSRIAIHKYDRSINSIGTPIEGYLFYKYAYADIKLQGGSLQTDPAPGTISQTNVSITMRYDPQINYNCKIVYLNNSYRIAYIEQIVNKGFLKLQCEVFNEDQPVGNE